MNVTPRMRATILVVEDDVQTREFYAQTLVAAGYEVVAVEDGLDALRRLEDAVLPDAVVLDLLLPRLSGLDLYRELRTRPRTKGIPVVVVTGADTREMESDLFRCFIRKPVHAEALVSVVDDALQGPPVIRS